jgi:hemin uptake protein HemP
MKSPQTPMGHTTSSVRPNPPQPELPTAIRATPLRSQQLMQGQKTLEIDHNGEIYRLQATRLGKLILTK